MAFRARPRGVEARPGRAGGGQRRHAATASGGPGWFVISLCDGLGCGFVASTILQVAFAGCAVEQDGDLSALASSHFPWLYTLDDMMHVTASAIIEMFDGSGCMSLLLMAGPPCQPFSGLGLQQGWDDPRSGAIAARNCPYLRTHNKFNDGLIY